MLVGVSYLMSASVGGMHYSLLFDRGTARLRELEQDAVSLNNGPRGVVLRC